MGPAAKKRKLNQPKVEEVVFDPADRHDYLTGFHKRKVQRTKAAQEAAAKKAREEKIEDRKRLRDERKADLERHVNEMNALLPSRHVGLAGEPESEDESQSEWTGIVDPDPEPIDHEAEYIDEDKYTSVTVEEVDITRDGISKIRNGENEEEEGKDENELKLKQATNPNSPSTSSKKIKERDKKPRKKKRDFRYESPADRKVNRLKERARKSKMAQKRRAE